MCNCNCAAGIRYCIRDRIHTNSNTGNGNAAGTCNYRCIAIAGAPYTAACRIGKYNSRCSADRRRTGNAAGRSRIDSDNRRYRAGTACIDHRISNSVYTCSNTRNHTANYVSCVVALGPGTACCCFSECNISTRTNRSRASEWRRRNISCDNAAVYRCAAAIAGSSIVSSNRIYRYRCRIYINRIYISAGSIWCGETCIRI